MDTCAWNTSSVSRASHVHVCRSVETSSSMFKRISLQQGTAVRESSAKIHFSNRIRNVPQLSDGAAFLPASGPAWCVLIRCWSVLPPLPASLGCLTRFETVESYHVKSKRSYSNMYTTSRVTKTVVSREKICHSLHCWLSEVPGLQILDKTLFSKHPPLCRFPAAKGFPINP